MEKAFAYLRVSDVSQVNGDGYVRQEKAVMDYAKAHNIKVVKIFREAMTGTEHERPVLAELMMSLEQNHHGVRTVIIEKLDRLARDIMIQEAVIKDFQTHGFKLVSVAEGADLCSNDPSRKAMRQIFGVIAEYEKSMLVAKLRAARERSRAKNGRCEGRKGYKGTVEGQRLIKRIKKLYHKPVWPERGKCLTYQQIADILNAENIPTINKRKWTVHSVRDIIVDR